MRQYQFICTSYVLNIIPKLKHVFDVKWQFIVHSLKTIRMYLRYVCWLMFHQCDLLSLYSQVYLRAPSLSFSNFSQSAFRQLFHTVEQ